MYQIITFSQHWYLLVHIIYLCNDLRGETEDLLDMKGKKDTVLIFNALWESKHQLFQQEL